ncbi:MAG: TlpA disulfide reductase family protein [Tunicatimonas sp.]
MINLALLVSLLLLPIVNAHGQYNYWQEKEVAGGDTAMFSGPSYKVKHLGSAREEHITQGIHRIVVSPKIDIARSFRIDIKDNEGVAIPFQRYAKYVEFYNPKGPTRIISITIDLKDEEKERLEADERVAGLYYVYAKSVSKKAPSFEFVDMAGSKYTNTSLLDKVVVFNFWHTRCTPCVREIPQLNELVMSLEERNDVVFVAVTPNTENDVRKFLEKRPFDYKQVVNYYDAVENFVDGQSKWPTHIILDKKGQIVFQYFGTYNDLHSELYERIQQHL